MPPIINFKICDNAPECGGIEVCPTKAIIWNESKKTLEVDDSKCINCVLCVKSCPVGAIKVATGKKLELIKQEYEKDQRRTSDLFIERYGASSMDPTALVSPIFFTKPN
jgi:NAD-dependent dihydropyrimidine dehydrogenase PreA subunit